MQLAIICITIPSMSPAQEISDHRQKQPACLPPSLNYDSLKELLDEALITKDYSKVSR